MLIAGTVALASAVVASPALAADPDVTPPSQVTGVTVTRAQGPLNNFQYTVRWSAATDDVGVTAYQVYEETPFGKFLYETTSGTATNSTPKYLGGEPVAVFTVVAIDAAGNASDSSAPYTTDTCEGNEPPRVSTPVGTTATDVTSNSATISWKNGPAACHGVPPTGFQIFADNGPGSSTLLGSAGPTATSATLTGALTPSTSYQVYVVATGGQSNGSAARVSVTTLPGTGAPDITPPSQVTGVAVTATPGASYSWDVSWAPATDDVGVTGYDIYTSDQLLATVLGTATSATKLAVNINSRAVPITVVARDAAGNRSVPSVPVTFNSCPATPDVQVFVPKSIQATNVGDTSATVTWNAPDDTVCDHAPTTEFGVFTTDHVKLGSAPAGATSTTLTGLAPETKYFVYVHAAGGLFPDPADDRAENSPTISFTTAKTQAATTVDYGITGLGTLKNLAKGTLSLSGSTSLTFTSTFNPGSPTPVKSFTGDLTLAPTTANLKALGFLPVTATVAFVPTAPLTGSSGDASANATAKVRIKLPSLKVLGISVGGGSSCQASQISTIPLFSSAPLLANGATLAGTFSISNLTGCGALNGLVSPLTSGSGNAIALTLKPAARVATS